MNYLQVWSPDGSLVHNHTSHIFDANLKHIVWTDFQLIAAVFTKLLVHHTAQGTAVEAGLLHADIQEGDEEGVHWTLRP